MRTLLMLGAGSCPCPPITKGLALVLPGLHRTQFVPRMSVSATTSPHSSISQEPEYVHVLDTDAVHLPATQQERAGGNTHQCHF